MKPMWKDRSILYCFSPPVMLVTMLIEGVLFIYTILRYRMTRFGRGAALTLLLLAAFQLSEYQICARSTHALLWARAGFVAITFLPVLGLYLVSLVNKKTHFLRLGYVLLLFYVPYFLIAPRAIQGAYCGGNYVIFNTAQAWYVFYGFYYFGFLLLAMWDASVQMYKDRLRFKNKKTVLFWFLIGYTSFLLPMGIVFLLSPSILGAVPSVMCGFAVFFALILVLKVLPSYVRAHEENR
ncbi:MAG: hypothetical protein KGI50_00055 [Patescibacteria group bacterium]|nr:hypothetical protein [Patescibacteria group bacterium]MDE2438246.1 hypothetical protein [Patescibacteria group bacterium]